MYGGTDIVPTNYTIMDEILKIKFLLSFSYLYEIWQELKLQYTEQELIDF
jgi:hypothetical protein